jgi:hypothetical protein
MSLDIYYDMIVVECEARTKARGIRDSNKTNQADKGKHKKQTRQIRESTLQIRR